MYLLTDLVYISNILTGSFQKGPVGQKGKQVTEVVSLVKRAETLLCVSSPQGFE